MGIFDWLRAGRQRKQPERKTDLYARLMSLGMVGTGRRRDEAMLKATPANLRYFSRTPHARRAINAIKNPIAMLEWRVVPKADVPDSAEIRRQCEVVTNCLNRPNQDDSFRTLVEQIVEDILVVGAGAIEQQIGASDVRPLWLWPVDGQSIQIYPLWQGGKDEARYVQTLGFGNYGGQQGRQLRNDELIYIRQDVTTASPFSYGPIEIAFNTISRLLSVGEYAGNVASNAQPANLLWLKGASEPDVQAFRLFWRNEVEGQGQTPILGWGDSVEAIRLRGTDDNALYLKYQEFVLRELAAAFGISPQNLGVEADVNRNTSEVAEDRDWDGTIKPLARLIEAHLNREAIEGRLGFSQIHFEFVGLDREDEAATADIYQTYYQGNAIVPNEQRARIGLPPLKNRWAEMTYADFQIAMASAKKGAPEDAPDTGSAKSTKAKVRKSGPDDDPA